MSKLGLLLLIATLALSGGVTAKAPPEESEKAEVAKAAETAQKPMRQRPEVIPLNTRGYNLPGPNDVPPAAIDTSSKAAPASPKPR